MDVQRAAMRIYRRLAESPAQWGGRLVLCCGPGCAGTGAASGVSIAGGATLAIDPEAAAGKAALRAGYLDFLVNSLDEALRALKNEVRQRRPIAVGLSAPVQPTLAEIVARGVQPDLYLRSAEADWDELAVLAERGMPTQATDGVVAVDEYLLESTTTAGLRELDAALLAMLPEGDPRRAWVQRAPQYLREARTGGRWIWASDGEFEDLRGQQLAAAVTAPQAAQR